MTMTPNCPHCNRTLVLRQRYVGGHGYGWYWECDECVYGIDALDAEHREEGAA